MRIEHVNITVSDPDASAATLSRIFGWHVRWSGAGLANGRTVHVGSDDDYLALYRPQTLADGTRYPKGEPLQHIGIEVEDIDAIEAKVVAEGFKPFSHGDYDPGRRFYFLDADGIEFEVVSYA